MSVRFCRVALDSPVSALDRPFDYAIPDRLIGRVALGSVVRVVLHGRSMRAFVTDLIERPAVPDPRPLRSLVSPQPLFGAAEVDLARWIARRYVFPLGRVLHEAVPGRFSATTSAYALPSPPARTPPPSWAGSDVASALQQRRALSMVCATVDEELALIAHVAGELESEGRMLVVCPRVELAERVVASVSGAAVMHGDERPAERAEAWARARDGAVRVLVGGRSALLAPLPGLRVVYVASAHDRALKAERAPRLHGLWVAHERARRAGASFMASSPAPPVELAARADVDVVSSPRSAVRAEVVRPGADPMTFRLTELLAWAVGRSLDAFVFVGRRGEALRWRCRDCGSSPACSECGAGLVPPAREGRVECRRCGYSNPAPTVCANCGGPLSARGWGHERVARAVEKLGLGAPVVRSVADEPAAEHPSPAIFVGTVAPRRPTIEAICVADLDQLLARPDFRAAEYALQTLHDLARALRPGGRFLIQTREPDHHAVQAFTRQSYRFFLDRELPLREQSGYPPYGVVVRVDLGPAAMDGLRQALEPTGATLVGGVARGGRTIALVRAEALEPLLDPLRSFAREHPRARIDVDPVDIL